MQNPAGSQDLGLSGWRDGISDHAERTRHFESLNVIQDVLGRFVISAESKKRVDEVR
jgi:hypothetical protein